MGKDTDKSVRFIESHHVALAAGEYEISLHQSLKVDGKTQGPFEATRKIAVFGERFALKDDDIFTVFPPQGSKGDHSHVLPHLTLTRSTLPWERQADPTAPKLGWLALLVFHDFEAPEIQSLTLADLAGPNMPDVHLEEIWQKSSDPVSVIDVPADLFDQIAPNFSDLSYLSHARQTLENDAPYGPEFATVIANRLPKPGGTTTVHLVSFENRFKDGTFIAEANAAVRLVTLYNWTFTCPPLGRDFAAMVQSLCAENGFSLPSRPMDTDLARARKADGYVLLPHDLTNGEQSLSWYRGPLAGAKHPDTPMQMPSILEADELYAMDTASGVMDISYGAAWQLGRLMAIQDQAFSTRLYSWKRTQLHARNALQSGKIFNALFSDRHARRDDASGRKFVLNWLEKLATLENVPFNYLVPDEAMLPQESLRIFHLDWMWIEYLLDGAFSIGRVMEADQKSDDAHKSSGAVPSHRDLVGVLIRSDLVADWPGLLVDGGTGREKIQPLRFERLARNVLIVLFDQDVDHIDLHLAPESLHFGLVQKADAGYEAHLRIDGKTTSQTVDALWHNPDLRTINIDSFAENLGKKLGQSMKEFSAADFALQMINGAPSIRFPVKGSS